MAMWKSWGRVFALFLFSFLKVAIFTNLGDFSASLTLSDAHKRKRKKDHSLLRACCHEEPCQIWFPNSKKTWRKNDFSCQKEKSVRCVGKRQILAVNRPKMDENWPNVPIELLFFPEPHRTPTKTFTKCAGAVISRESSNTCFGTTTAKKKSFSSIFFLWQCRDRFMMTERERPEK